jgi:hypothetical protein
MLHRTALIGRWPPQAGPIIGGALGGFAHKFALMTRHPKDETKY